MTSLAAVSFVCVFNDPAVRAQCLDASLTRAADPGVEYLPVDNTTGRFTCAGAALNEGARRARHPVIAFVHQDVYIHSVEAVRRAAGRLLEDDELGLVGAVGAGADGSVVGRIRDRLDLSGQRVDTITPVDSVDEVLFLLERDRVLASPLGEEPELGWHAYAVEYGARVRAAGLKVVVADIPVTHNSLTTNLARLDQAHRCVARRYPQLLPINTTCGRIGIRGHRARRPAYARLRREARLARDLLRARRHVGFDAELWLTNIRFEVDRLMEGRTDRLTVVNVVRGTPFPDEADPLVLSRRGRTVELSSGDARYACRVLTAAPTDRSCLVTDVPAGAVRTLLAARPDAVAGFDPSTGFWVAVGPLTSARETPSGWSGRRYKGRPSSARQPARREQGIATR